MPEFELPGPITLVLRIGGGGAEVVAEERTTASVEVTPDDTSDASREAAANTRVGLYGDSLVVQAPEWTGWMFRRGPRVRVRARVPLDTTLAIKVSSADVRCTGRYASASVATASGDVYVEHVTGTATVNAASGDVRLDRVGGQLGVNTASGDTSVGEIGGDLDVKSASGDVTVGVATGTGVWLDLSSTSGSVSSDLATDPTRAEPGSAELTVQVRTISGDIDVVRAAQTQVTRTAT